MLSNFQTSYELQISHDENKQDFVTLSVGLTWPPWATYTQPAAGMVARHELFLIFCDRNQAI